MCDSAQCLTAASGSPRVTAGQRVLVTAAAGGVGHLTVQLAKERGAYVLGTAREVNHGFLRGLGVDEPIDYTTVDVAATVRDVDVVIQGVLDDSLVATLRPGGVIVPLPGGVPDTLAAAAEAAGVRAVGHVVTPDGPGLARLVALADAGRLHVEVSQVLPLE